MRKMAGVLVCVACLYTASVTAQPVRQTARQALLEAFFGKPGSLEKHLPQAMLTALQQVDAGNSQLDMISLMTHQLTTQGQVQTFDAGSTLVSFEDPKTQSKFQINVEKDDLRGDEDEIELSFYTEKNGQAQDSHITPRLTFLMKSEAGVWRVNEISFRITVPLSDPAFLKSVVDGIKQRQTMMAANSGPFHNSAAQEPSSGPMQAANESGAIAALRTILTAEVTYAATYPGQGYTCFLSDLDGFGRGEPNEHQAMLIDSRLAGGRKNGYVFRMSGCTTSPVTHFEIIAVPAEGNSGRAFCSDESGVIRFASNGSPATCVHSGSPLR